MHYKKTLVALVFMSFLLNCKEEGAAINTIITRFHNGNGQWIYAPKQITISYDDNEESVITIPSSEDLLVPINISKVGKTRTLKLSILYYGIISEGKQRAGNKAWTFIDEIIVN